MQALICTMHTGRCRSPDPSEDPGNQTRPAQCTQADAGPHADPSEDPGNQTRPAQCTQADAGPHADPSEDPGNQTRQMQMLIY